MKGKLKKVLKRYFAAMRAGKLDEVLELSSRELQAEAAEVLTTEEERKALIDRQRSGTPESFEILRMEAEGEGNAVSLVVLTSTGGSRSKDLVTLVREGPQWRVADILPAGGEHPVERAEDDDREDAENYNFDARSSICGRVVRTAFEEEHSLIVLRAMDKEFSVFRPPRQWLVESGFDPEILVPGATVEVDALPHRTNELKSLMKNMTVL